MISREELGSKWALSGRSEGVNQIMKIIRLQTTTYWKPNTVFFFKFLYNIDLMIPAMAETSSHLGGGKYIGVCVCVCVRT